MPFQQGDTVMHSTEGWYGVVMKAKGEDLYNVLNLEAEKTYRKKDLKPVSYDELPVGAEKLVRPVPDILLIRKALSSR
jgi:hypothetical protein